MKDNIRPIDFWGIGAPKSGTTWLYHNLKKIYLFYFPPIKELHYFDRSSHYSSSNDLSEAFMIKRIGLGYCLKSIWSILRCIASKQLNNVFFYFKWYYSNYNDEWYISLFKTSSDKCIRGEITPTYSILDYEDIEKMFRISPNAKILLMVRDPIERAWSNYLHTNRKNKNLKINNDDIIKYIDSPHQELRSDYIAIISKYQKTFNKKQIMIGFFDAIIDKPNHLLENIIHFLAEKSVSVDRMELNKKISELDLNKKINETKNPNVKCPEIVKKYLMKKYHKDIKKLHNKYGSFFTVWYYKYYKSKKTNFKFDCHPTIIVNN